MTDEELNQAVAERVMGWEQDPDWGTWDRPDGGMELTTPIFTDPNWTGVRLVVERMRELGWRVSIELDRAGLWDVVFFQSNGDVWLGEANKSAPRAVCLAALKAVGGGE